MQKPLIVVIEDEQIIVDSYVGLFEENNFEVKTYLKERDFVWDFNSNSEFRKRISILLLDLNLKELDGRELLGMVANHRDSKHISVIVVSANDDEKTRNELLQLGANDFCHKTISDEELLARINVQLRINQKISTNGDTKKESENNRITFAEDEMFIDDYVIKLTLTELKMMKLFAKNQKRFLSRFQIEEAVFEIYSSLETKAVDVTLSRIRKKLATTNADFSDLITSSRNLGWKFELPDSP